MNHDQQLKLQAYLDGELSGREASDVARMLEGDAEARQLYGELSRTRQLLRENEPAHAVVESREFYWSKIERAISQPEPAAVAAGVSGWAALAGALRRFAAPVTGVAVAALVLVFATTSVRQSVPIDLSHLSEVEAAIEEMGVITYRSYADDVTFVWFYDRSDSAVNVVEPGEAGSL